MTNNIRLYPWYLFFRNLSFWQAVWFLFFQDRLSAAEAIVLYAVYDIATTVIELPSGYLSDRVGRRVTLILAALATLAGLLLLSLADGFLAFALAQACLGAGSAFASGTDSSLLFESLAGEGRADEAEAQELRAWRFSFTALAVSAVAGGALTTVDPALPFAASAVAGGVVLVLTLSLREPRHLESAAPEPLPRALARSLSHPVLAWCFCLAAAMYLFSHVPFAFGQPFIAEALASRGMSADAPLVSGAITAAMMVVSVATSWMAPGLRRRIGLPGILLMSLGIQVFLIGMLAWSAHVLVISLLLLRMVPNSLSRPFLLARIQPLLKDAHRATFLSLQSLSARLLLAGSLILLSGDASDEAALSHGAIQSILAWYLGAGLLVFFALAATSRVLRADRNEIERHRSVAKPAETDANSGGTR